METLIAPAINVLILVSVMAYYLRQPLRDFVTTRHAFLRDELKRVAEQLREAQARFDEFSSKLKAIDAEITALREQSKQDAEAMRLRVLQDARKSAANIVTDARAAAEGVFAELRTELRRELGQKVVERAEKLLHERLTGDDRSRIRREFSKQVESIQ